MILYKFKSLQSLEHVFDILHNQRLFCTKYTSLNDPFEGVFWATITYPPWLSGYKYPLKKHRITKKVNDLIFQVEHSKICSLSRDFRDVRLWSHYADGHKGIAIAIDFSNIESFVHKVIYSAELPEFGNTILTSPAPTDVLTRKTKHWEYEEEYRVIQDKDYYPINGRIKTIFTGQRISDFHIELLKKITPGEISIYATKLNTQNVLIEKDKLIQEKQDVFILK